MSWTSAAQSGAPERLRPLLAQYDQAIGRILARLGGPSSDSGDGEWIEVSPLTDDEYLWEPAPGSWSVRRRVDGPGVGATLLVGGDPAEGSGSPGWGRDGGRPHPWPPPITTIAWRLNHLSEQLVRRADYTIGSHSLTADAFPAIGEAAPGIAQFRAASADWRATLAAADDAALDRVGHCSFPDGSDSEEVFLDLVWWVNQEVLHHGAEIALLRDLFRAAGPPRPRLQ